MAKPQYDQPTLDRLVRVAKDKLRRAEKQFEKYDNADDMNEAAHWRHVVNWLEGL